MDRSVENPFNTADLFIYSILAWTAAVPATVAVIFLLRAFEFSRLIMAQASVGAFGFAGGLLHALHIRKSGGTVLWKNAVFLSSVWAVCCMGSVTPLFFTSGMPLKMTVLAFYSFSIFGALGGFLTSCTMKSVFEDSGSAEIAPSVIAWSFGFGSAAVAGESIGECLQSFLPEPILWLLAFMTMSLFIGFGGGYSTLLFLKSKRKKKRFTQETNLFLRPPSDRKNTFHVGVLFLLSAPFYLNDFSTIFVNDWRLWIFIDYISVKLIPFAVLFWLIHTHTMTIEDLGLGRVSFITFVTVFLIATLTGIFIDQNGYLLSNLISGYPSLGRIPPITSPLWKWIDLTFGLLMVGIFEELVFRGYLRIFFSRYTKNIFIIVGFSALAFGLIHWSGGMNAILTTSVIGAVFMTLYVRTDSLWAIILAHFTINFIDFAEVVPKTVFRFF